MAMPDPSTQGKTHPKMIPVDPHNPSPQVIARVAACIRSGGVVAIPTDTFYGLAADPRDAAAVRRLFEIKGRAFSKPIPILAAHRAMLTPWITGISPAVERLMAAFWPGPLTLILRSASAHSDLLMAGTGTLGVRLPTMPFLIRLMEGLGHPITATSANRSGGPNPLSARAVAADLGDGLDLIVDGGVASSLPSSLVDVTASPFRLLREGAIPHARLAPYLIPQPDHGVRAERDAQQIPGGP